ncbi:hypothetical protein Tco_0731139 [Tanacetum coccineum]
MATSALLPVFQEAVSLSSSSGMTVYNLPPQNPAPGGLGIVVGVVAMATNILLAYPKISTPYKKQLLARSKRPFRYNPPSAVSRNHSLRRTHARAISALIQEHKVFGDYMNGTDFSPFGLKGSTVKKFQFVPYTCLIDDIRYKRVTHVQLVKDSSLINYNTKTSVDRIAESSKTVLGRTSLGKAFASKWEYQTVYVGDDMSPLIEYLKHHQIAYGSDPKPLSVTLTDVLSFIFVTFPYFIFLVLECYLISTQLNLGKRKEQSVTFAGREVVQ